MARLNRRTLVLASVPAYALASGRFAAVAQTTRLEIATGGTAGVYYPYGGALANLLSDNLENTEVTA